MLFIHHNDADPFQRGKDGRPRTDHDPYFTPPDTSPFIIAFTIGKGAVQHGNPLGKAGTKTLHQLGGQGDFRHQHQGIPARSKGVGDPLQIDFGLAAAGNTMQQKRGKTAGVQSGQDG